MSYRYNNAFVKPGLNTLASPAPNYTYGLWSWGANTYGQLGLGNQTDYSSPKQVGALVDWKKTGQIGLGMAFATVKTDGTLWTWGRNIYGQLGLNNITGYSSPKQVGALTNWLSVAAGYYNAFAIKTDGTLWSWGLNYYGQLGLGNTTTYSSPKQVGSLTNWLKVSSSSYYTTMAIKTDGTLWGWGRNNGGQIGIGNTTNYSSPMQIGALTNWLSVCSSGYAGHTLAVKKDGTLWAWGRNNGGQLGLNNTINYSSPVQVGSLTNWLDVTCGSYSSYGITTSGTIFSWGTNFYGQLGLGNTTNYSSPKQIGALTTWQSITGNASYNCFAIKQNNSLWAWGNNQNGILGLGDVTNRSSPTQVGALTTWGAVFPSARCTFALQY